MEEFLKAVSNFGFPIVVAAYLLLRMEKKIDSLTASIQTNTTATKSLTELIDRRLK